MEVSTLYRSVMQDLLQNIKKEFERECGWSVEETEAKVLKLQKLWEDNLRKSGAVSHSRENRLRVRPPHQGAYKRPPGHVDDFRDDPPVATDYPLNYDDYGSSTTVGGTSFQMAGPGASWNTQNFIQNRWQPAQPPSNPYECPPPPRLPVPHNQQNQQHQQYQQQSLQQLQHHQPHQQLQHHHHHQSHQQHHQHQQHQQHQHHQPHQLHHHQHHHPMPPPIPQHDGAFDENIPMNIDANTKSEMRNFLNDCQSAYHGPNFLDFIVQNFASKFNLPSLDIASQIIKMIQGGNEPLSKRSKFSHQFENLKQENTNNVQWEHSSAGSAIQQNQSGQSTSTNDKSIAMCKNEKGTEKPEYNGGVTQEDIDRGDEEDPLGPQDDDPYDQEPETNNLIFAQYEKVSRSRNKWKCILRDGIMHINGRDYCFHRASGDLKW